MAKEKKVIKPGSVAAYMELKGVFQDWLKHEKESAHRAFDRSSEKLRKVRPEVLEHMHRLNLDADDVFTRKDIDDATLALLEQYTTLNLEHDMAARHMVAIDRTREGNFGPAFEAFLASDQEYQFLHLDMVKEMFA